jgi:hypothetical protein
MGALNTYREIWQMTTAHIFWEGELGNLQISSMISYQKKGFDVFLWSLSPHKNIPDGIINKDANEIFKYDDIDLLTILGNLPEHNRYSAYSDFFRFRVLKKYPGWYFDADTVCLKSVEDFEALQKHNKNFIIGAERDDTLLAGTSVLYFNNLDILDTIIERQARYLSDILLSEHRQVGWTDFGPPLLTKCLVDINKFSELIPSNYFYKIPSTSAHLFYQAPSDNTVNSLSDSYVAHWWGSNAIYNSTNSIEESLISYLFRMEINEN